MAGKLGGLILGVLLLASSSAGQASSLQEQERLAQGWFEAGEFYRARTAYWRLYHYSLSGQGRDMLFLRWRSQRRLHQLAFHNGNGQEAYMAMANAWTRLRFWGLAPEQERLWQRDLALMQLWQGSYAAAERHFARLQRHCRKKPQQPPSRVCLSHEEPVLAMGRKAARKLHRWTRPEHGGYWQERHKPWFSALLSFFFPGLGQMYNGEWRLGLLSTMTVGGLGGLSYWAYRDKRPVAASLFLYMAVVYHQHNINRAMASAARYNRRLFESRREGYFVRLRRRVSWLP
jgi:hypothetical protein